MKKHRDFLTIAFAIVLFGMVPGAHAQGGARPAQAPVGATLVSPSGAIGTNNPTYMWNSVFDASWYYIYIQGPSGLVDADWYSAAQVCVADTCSLANVKTLAVGEHRWWIQTWNGSGYGPWSAGMTFTVPAPTPPGQATLTSPNGNIVTNDPTYTWNKVADATWYYLYVSGPSSYVFTNWYRAVDFCDASTCLVSNATPSLAGGDYRWWVQTWNNSGGYGSWSTGMSFSLPVPKVPVATTLISPNENITNTQPTYTWNAVLDSEQGDAATWYFLWVQDSTGVVIQQWYPASTSCSGGLCSVTPSIAVTPGSTRWWVQTWNSGGYGPWSAGMSFYIAIPWPLQPTLISPSGTITTRTPTYSWNAVSSETGVPANWYQLSVNTSTGNLLTQWQPASSVCVGGTCSLTPSTMLTPGQNYTWQVRGYNSAGNGPWSNSMSFTVASNCSPAYPGVCIPPPPPDLDCGNIPYRNFTVLAPDPHNFDGDRDGIGCETP